MSTLVATDLGATFGPPPSMAAAPGCHRDLFLEDRCPVDVEHRAANHPRHRIGQPRVGGIVPSHILRWRTVASRRQRPVGSTSASRIRRVFSKIRPVAGFGAISAAPGSDTGWTVPISEISSVNSVDGPESVRDRETRRKARSRTLPRRRRHEAPHVPRASSAHRGRRSRAR